MFIVLNFHGVILEDIIFSSGYKKNLSVLGAVAQNGHFSLMSLFDRYGQAPLYSLYMYIIMVCSCARFFFRLQSGLSSISST